LPAISWEKISALTGPALTIALLGGIESLLSAVVADGMTGRRHRSNMELIAQGLANLATPLFGGIPATGAIARTAANVKNGGATPIAGMWHAVTLLVIMLVLGRWVALIPMAALAGILVMVAYNMSEAHLFVRMLRSPIGDVAVLIATFLLTVLLDLTVAIQVGVVLSALLFMQRMAQLTQVTRLDSESFSLEDPEETETARPRLPKGVEVFEIFGPFFFGAADKFQTALQLVNNTKVLIIRMRMVPAIDATALAALESQVRKAQANGMRVILAELQVEPRRTLERAGLVELLGVDQIQPSLEGALAQAQRLL
jgi:sulfate permease, SulP family